MNINYSIVLCCFKEITFLMDMFHFKVKVEILFHTVFSTPFAKAGTENARSCFDLPHGHASVPDGALKWL